VLTLWKNAVGFMPDLITNSKLGTHSGNNSGNSGERAPYLLPSVLACSRVLRVSCVPLSHMRALRVMRAAKPGSQGPMRSLKDFINTVSLPIQSASWC
jgi:hypothetical protein